MKWITRSKQQRGFFDLGISLIILAIGAGTAAVVTATHDETAVAQSDSAKTELAVPRDE